MRSAAKSVEEYLSELPEDRKVALEEVRQVILRNLPNGYEEMMNWGMITYQVPFSTYPDTYNKKPLMYAALASQKNHMSLYLMSVYMEEEAKHDFKAKYLATGKKYDIGKSCVRFKKLDDLPLQLVGDAIAKYDVDEFVNKVKHLTSLKKKNRK